MCPEQTVRLLHPTTRIPFSAQALIHPSLGKSKLRTKYLRIGMVKSMSPANVDTIPCGEVFDSIIFPVNIADKLELFVHLAMHLDHAGFDT